LEFFEIFFKVLHFIPDLQEHFYFVQNCKVTDRHLHYIETQNFTLAWTHFAAQLLI